MTRQAALSDKIDSRSAYNARYRKEHRKQLRLASKKYYAKNKSQLLLAQRQRSQSWRDQRYWSMKNRRDAIRKQCIELLGGKCCRCGFQDYRALQLDHRYGNGFADRRIIGSIAYYRHVLQVGKKKFQLLCANCNWIKRAENNEVRRRGSKK